MTTIISNITSSTGNTPTAGPAAYSGATYYEDEAYAFSNLAGWFFNREYLKTHNADFGDTSAEAYTFDAVLRCLVYVCVDPAMTTLPAWLDDGLWALHWEVVGTDNSGKIYPTYVKEFAAGATVSLGGNSQVPSAGSTENYFVMVQNIGIIADNSLMKNIHHSMETPCVTVTMAVGLRLHLDDPFAIDREWATVPVAYLGLTTLQTAMRDSSWGFWTTQTLPANIVSGRHITFNVERNVIVYLYVDDLRTMMTWVTAGEGWTDTGDNFIDDSGTPLVFSIWQKTYAAGSEVVLGAPHTGGSPAGEHYGVMIRENDLPTIVETDELVTGTLVSQMLSRCNSPYTRVTMQLSGEGVIDITNYLLQVPIIDRKKGIYPSDGHTLTQTDAVFTVANINSYFSPQSTSSVFYGKDYFDAKIVVYAGFFSVIDELMIDSTATVTSQLVVYLDQVRVDSSNNSAQLVCRGTAKKLDRLKVGEPDAAGAADDLVYAGTQSFKTIVESLLGTHGGLAASEYNVQDVAITFDAATFSDIGIIEAVSKLCQVATCAFYEDRKGALTIDTFSIDFGEVDIREVTEEQAIIRLVADENVNNLLSKVTVTGATGIYEENDTSGNAKGQIVNISNDLVQTSGAAVDIIDDLFLRWGTNQPLVEIETVFMPTIDVGDIIQALETQTGIINFEYEVYRVSLDTSNYKMVLYGIRQDLSQKFAFVGSESTEASDPAAPQNVNYAAASTYDKGFCYSRDRDDVTTDQPYYVYGRRV